LLQVKTIGFPNFMPLMFLGTFITWTPEMTTGMIGYIQNFITDISPLLIPIIAIGLGLIIFSVVVSVIRK